jgi:hypothetical protein
MRRLSLSSSREGGSARKFPHKRLFFAPHAVHDGLRVIPSAERKTITDLITAGLDHDLTSRNYAPTAELKQKKR